MRGARLGRAPRRLFRLVGRRLREFGALVGDGALDAVRVRTEDFPAVRGEHVDGRGEFRLIARFVDEFEILFHCVLCFWFVCLTVGTLADASGLSNGFYSSHIRPAMIKQTTFHAMSFAFCIKGL